jgi:hypothetical protein
MVSIYVREIGHVMIQAGIIALTGVVFHGLPGRWQNAQLSSARGQLPLIVSLAPVTP